MEKMKKVLKKLVTDTGMLILTALSVAGTWVIWWSFTISPMGPFNVVVTTVVTVFIWFQTWKYGYRQGLFSV